ncbi:hypothetical protein BS78_02G393100 [Paspalum vaginatum]|nr:hypothetical protein BS78_02G393100 [Paspalum vaginatum]
MEQNQEALKFPARVKEYQKAHVAPANQLIGLTNGRPTH